MKDMVSERLIQLSTAQECLIHAADIMEQVNLSQQFIEKNSYESMNTTDKVLNFSKEGKHLVTKLRERGNAYIKNPSETERDRIIDLLEEMNGLLCKIIETASEDNEIQHSIEHEVANQCVLTDHLKDELQTVSKSVDQAAACAELIIAMDF